MTVGTKDQARVTVDGADELPPIVEFDAHGLARVRIVRWEGSGRTGDPAQPSYSRYILTNTLRSIHVTEVQALEPREVLADGSALMVDFGGPTPGAAYYDFAWCQFGPLEKSWAAIRHAYGLRLRELLPRRVTA